jgi:glutamine cyclotransferase
VILFFFFSKTSKTANSRRRIAQIGEYSPKSDKIDQRILFRAGSMIFFFVILFLIRESVLSHSHDSGRMKKAEGKLQFRTLETISHDSSSFTQGIFLHNDGFLYESGGLYGHSTLRKVDPTTGTVVKYVDIPKKYFAEGITVIGEMIFMLTWKERTLLIFSTKDLMYLGSCSYSTYNGEGWGLTFNGQHLIASDGSDHLTYFELPKDDLLETPTLVKVISSLLY